MTEATGPLIVVEAAAVVVGVPHPENATAGADVYPAPGAVIVTVVEIFPPATGSDVAVAPAPPPPVIATAGVHPFV